MSFLRKGDKFYNFFAILRVVVVTFVLAIVGWMVFAMANGGI